MKKKRKKLKKRFSSSKRRKFKKIKKQTKKTYKKKIKKKRKVFKKRRKSRIKKKSKVKLKARKAKKQNQKTRSVINAILNLSDKLKSIFSLNFNLDRTLQKFFQGLSNYIFNIKKVIQEEREKQRKVKIQAMEREKIEAQKRFKQQEDFAIKAKTLELKEEEKLGRERKIELQKFIRLEQAELRKERAEKQRKFLEQIALEKKIIQFRKREALEIKNLERYVLSHQRESYEEVQKRIDRIKEKYRALRE